MMSLLSLAWLITKDIYLWRLIKLIISHKKKSHINMEYEPLSDLRLLFVHCCTDIEEEEVAAEAGLQCKAKQVRGKQIAVIFWFMTCVKQIHNRRSDKGSFSIFNFQFLNEKHEMAHPPFNGDNNNTDGSGLAFPHNNLGTNLSHIPCQTAEWTIWPANVWEKKNIKR